MNPFLIISYATKNTPYEQILDDYLLKSVRKQGLPYYTELIDDLGTWYKNTAYKPKFILETLDKFKDQCLVFIDADATIERYPDLFLEIPEYYDLGIHFLDRNKWYGHNETNNMELLSGTIFLRNNEHIRRLVRHWHEEAERTQEWEQKALQRVLKQHIDINVSELPLSYCYIKTLPNGREPLNKIDNPVIVHYQLSRQLKRRKYG